jgi:hypothetical protein
MSGKVWNGTFRLTVNYLPERAAYCFILSRLRPDGVREYFKLVPTLPESRHEAVDLDDDNDMKLLDEPELRQLLREFVDQARNHGVAGDAAENQAQTRHLEDMRRLVFDGAQKEQT